jgi:tetratricopeptide (TPR) repeat protein
MVLTSLTAAAIATLAFQKFIESGAGELAKKFTEAAIAKMDEIREKVWIKLRGKPEAESALAAVENGSEKNLGGVIEHLQAAMDGDSEFASEIRVLGQEINAGKLVDQTNMTQNNHDQARGYQIEVKGGTAYIGENHFHGQSRDTRSIFLDHTPLGTEGFQGREQELVQLRQWFDENRARLVGILSPGGYGKSTLAAVAYKETSKHKLWISFKEQCSFNHFGHGVLEELGTRVDEKMADESLINSLIKYFAEHQSLLVLDNLEVLLGNDNDHHFTDPGYQQFLLKWLEKSHRSTILLTSRVQPAALVQDQAECKWHHLEGLTSDAGIRVLRDQQTGGEEADLRRFINIADGHPLLLRLGAGWLKEHPNPNGFDILTQRDLDLFNDLAGSRRGETQTRIGNLLTASVEHLNSQLRSLWLDLSVYNFPFGSKAAKATFAQSPEDITEDFLKEDLSKVEENLRELVNYSLLNREWNSNRNEWQYRFLGLIKDFAREYPGDRTEAKLKAIEYCRLVAMPSGWSEHEALTAAYYRVVVKPPNWKTQGDVVEYLEVFHYYLEINQYAPAFYFLWHTGCDAFLELQGHNRLRAELFEDLRARWNSTENSTDVERLIFARMLDCLGNAYRSLGQYALAIESYNRALAIFRAIGNQREEAVSLRNLGKVYHAQGRFQEAVEHADQARAIFHTINNDLGEFLCLQDAIEIDSIREQYESNINRYISSIQLWQERNNRYEEASSWKDLGVTYKKLGRYQEAKVLGKARRIFRKISSESSSHESSQYRSEQRQILLDLGSVYEGLSRLPDKSPNQRRSRRARCAATTACRQALQISDNGLDQAISRCSLGWVLSYSGQPHEAIEHYKHALKIFRESDNRGGEAQALNGLGAAHYNLNDLTDLLAFWWKLYLKIQNDGFQEAENLEFWFISFAYHLIFGRADLTEADRFYREALAIYRELGDRGGEAVILNNLGTLSERRTQYTEAVDWYQQSLTIECKLPMRDLHIEAITRHNIGRVCNLLGKYYSDQRQYQAAARFYRQSRGAFKGIKGDFRTSYTDSEEAIALSALAKAYHFLGRYSKAIRLHQDTLEMMRKLGDRPGEADALLGLGDAHYALGNYIEPTNQNKIDLLALLRGIQSRPANPNAIYFYRQALVIFREINNFLGIAKVQLGLSKTYHVLGQCQKAMKLLNEGDS